MPDSKTIVTEEKKTVFSELEEKGIDLKQDVEAKELALKINPKTQKLILFTPISKELKTGLLKLMEELIRLRESIFSKRERIISRLQSIMSKISKLLKIDKIKIDKTKFEEMEKSVRDYNLLLERISKEISNEISYYSIFCSEKDIPIEKIVVPIEAPDELEAYLNVRLPTIKHYIKTVKRDLSISFSRYEFSFNEHFKRISVIESYLKKS